MPRDDLQFLAGPVVGTGGRPSRGIIAGRHVFLSGVIATDATGQIVGVGDLGAQARQAFANLKAFLAGAGAAHSDVVKMTVYIAAPDSFGEEKEALSAFLGDHRPAMTVIAVPRFVNPDALIEVDATAVLRGAAD